MITNMGNIQYCDNGSMAAVGSDAMSWKDYYTSDSVKENEESEKSKENFAGEISGAEWTRFGEYLIYRIEEFMPEQEEYKLLQNMMPYVGKHDREQVRNQLRKMNQNMILEIFGKAKTKEEKKEVVRILQKIIKQR